MGNHIHRERNSNQRKPEVSIIIQIRYLGYRPRSKGDNTFGSVRLEHSRSRAAHSVWALLILDVKTDQHLPLWCGIGLNKKVA